MSTIARLVGKKLIQPPRWLPGPMAYESEGKEPCIRSLNGREFDAHGESGIAETVVVGGKFEAEASVLQIEQRRQMDRIERPKGNRERLQGALQDRAREVHQFNCFKKISGMLGYVRRMPKRVQAYKNLVFQ